jgi:hypothetical protein
MISGNFVAGTVKVYSVLVMLSFPTIEECTKIQNEMYGDNTKCFITYKEVYDTPKTPPNRPHNLYLNVSGGRQ